MSERKNKLDMGDYAEATLQGATTAAESLRKSRAGKLAGAFLKKANPVEAVLTGIETMALLPPKGKKGEDREEAWRKVRAARAKAAAEVEAMALDPNVTQVDRFIKGLADPVRTGYGIVKGVLEMRQSMANRDKSRVALSEAGNRAAQREIRKAWEVMKQAREAGKKADLLNERITKKQLKWATEDAEADVKARAAVTDRYIQNKEYSPQDWRR